MSLEIKNYNTHIIHLSGEINFTSVRETMRAISEANEDNNVGDIILTVTTMGGFLYPAFALYDYIRASQKPIDVIAIGCCMSAGVMILQAGRKRLCYPHTLFMIHPSQYSLPDEKGYHEVLFMIDQYKKDHDTFIQLTINRSGITQQDFDSYVNPVKYLNPDEALKFGPYGLIDEVVSYAGHEETGRIPPSV